jgi:mRNA interferase MazF
VTPVVRRCGSGCAAGRQGKKGQVALDQIRIVDKSRLVRKLGRVDDAAGIEIAAVLTEMFAIG